MKELKEIKNITDKFVKKTEKFIESQKEPILKRCPFCGGQPVLLPENMVQCMTYECPMHPDYIMPIENWNNRKKIKSVLKEWHHQYYLKTTKAKRKAMKTAPEQKDVK